MEEIFASLERGAVLLTATRRLARDLRQHFAAWQRDQGRTLWKTPRILPLEAYVRQLWTGWLAVASENLVLLSPEQEAAVWEQMIRDSPEGASLLQVDATARRAMEAWQSIQAWRLPLDERYRATEDCAAFLDWARAFEHHCRRHSWIDGSRLSDFIINRLRAGEVVPPSTAWFAGFDEIAPQQRDLLSEINAQSYELPLLRTVTRTKLCATADDEIRCAADWARGIIEENPAARIGVVVPGLTQLRSRIDRIFRDVLQPGAPEGAQPAFHISLGMPLERYPIIHAALLILEFAAADRMPLTKVGMLLRSPFLGGAALERAARGVLDARLRRSCGWEISIEELRGQIYSECRILNRALNELEHTLNNDTLNKRTGTLPYAQWSRTSSELLMAMGWPGDRTLNSHEHQLLRRWTELLSQFAALDSVAVPLAFGGAVERLRALAAGSVFQYEDTGAPVQISDHMEIAGVRFDHLWVMGLHDEALPAAADPNPFLPISLQWEHRLPKASAERQYESARVVFDRLRLSAPDVVLSFPQFEGDRMLSASPLLTATPQAAGARTSAWIASIRASADMEIFVDETGPPHTDEGVQRGGVSLLRDMAACPFRAFASHRLGAKELERIEPGLSGGDKGTSLHEVLKLIWTELRSHDALSALAADDLTVLIRRHIAAVVDRLGDSTAVKVERIRLEKLLTKWFDIERRRQPFTILKLEEKKPVEIGGLQLEIRADRVDELPDGRQVIVDYKTGDIKSQGWTPPRLDEPQVPLYCVSIDAPVTAALFARIQAAWMGFHGIADLPLPVFRSYGGKNGPPLQEQIREWRTALEPVARQFREGDARVDPKHGHKTCEYCAIVSLCRIREYSNA